MARRAKTDVRLDIQIESKALLDKLKRISKATGKTRATVIRSAMNLFTQSVVKATPPLTVSRYLEKINIRRVIPVGMEQCRSFMAYASNPQNRVKNPAFLWEQMQHKKPKDHPWVTGNGYKIIFRRPNKTYARLYPTHVQADAHRSIIYRNLGKQSWIAAMSVAGVITSAARPPATAQMMGVARAIATGVGPKETYSYLITAYLQTRVHSIGRYAKHAIAKSLRYTNTRLKWELKSAEKKVANA